MEAEKQRQYDAMKLRIQYMYESNDYSFMDVLMKSTDWLTCSSIFSLASSNWYRLMACFVFSRGCVFEVPSPCQRSRRCSI